MSNYREQISELEQAQTDVQGQTIKDKIEGISFTTNPAFKEQSSGFFWILWVIFKEFFYRYGRKDRTVGKDFGKLTKEKQFIGESKQGIGGKKFDFEWGIWHLDEGSEGETIRI